MDEHIICFTMGVSANIFLYRLPRTLIHSHNNNNNNISDSTTQKKIVFIAPCSLFYAFCHFEVNLARFFLPLHLMFSHSLDLFNFFLLSWFIDFLYHLPSLPYLLIYFFNLTQRCSLCEISLILTHTYNCAGKLFFMNNESA